MSENTVSFKAEFMVEGKWYSSVRFATEEEAHAEGHQRFMSWYQPTDMRVVPSTDPVNYKWDPETHQAERLEE